MPTPKRSISSRVAKQNPRPRKYATAAERQKALRERFPTLCVRVEQEQADFMKRIADEQGRTLQDVHLAFIKYANGRGNQWLTQGLKGFAPLPRFEETPKENPTMKRKPTPAQIAARERFAEMARSGAFKRKAKRNPAKKTVSQKISQLTREGYPQKQAVAIALSEERAGKVRQNPSAKDSRTEVHLGGRYYGLISKNSGLGHYTDIVYRDPRDFEGDKVVPDFNGRYYQSMNAALRALERYKKKMILENPRASNPIILVSDKPIATKRKANPVKPKVPKYTVQTLTSGKANWKRVAMFDSLEQAKAYAEAVPRAYKVVAVRVIDDK